MCVNIYNLYIYSNYYQRITFSIESSDFKIYEHVLQCALDYLREGFPWSARPFKHTESNSFRHTVTTFICQYKYTNWCFILVTTSWASRSGPPSTYVNVVTVYTNRDVHASQWRKQMWICLNIWYWRFGGILHGMGAHFQTNKSVGKAKVKPTLYSA